MGLKVRKNPHAVALGRLGGRATKGITSPEKASAAKQNGKLGGAPRLPDHKVSARALQLRKIRASQKRLQVAENTPNKV